MGDQTHQSCVSVIKSYKWNKDNEHTEQMYIASEEE